MDLSKSLSRIIKDLMLEEPFYGFFLIGLDKTWDENIPTACVGMKDINYFLRINPQFWEELPDDDKRKGLLKHELCHIGYFHLTDYGHLENKEIANWAKDIEINQYIPANQLPKGGLLPETFPELNLEAKKGTNYYYKKLMENKDNSPTMQALLGQSGMVNGVLLPDHDWDVEEMSESIKELMKAQTKHMLENVVEQVEKSRGTVPGNFAEIIKKLQELDPPKFDWRGAMRRYIGKSTKTYTRKTRRKFNKRLPDFPGLKIKNQKHALVAFDTSGSVSTKELKDFIAEMHHIQRTGTEVTLIEADTSISYIGKFKPAEDIEIHGRGGTSFQPVIDYYAENLKKYSCLFYFTDGEAPSPKNARGNIMWVLSEESEMNDSLPGMVIQLN